MWAKANPGISCLQECTRSTRVRVDFRFPGLCCTSFGLHDWVRRRCVWKNAICTSLGREKMGKHKQDQKYRPAVGIKKNIKERVRIFQDLMVILWCPLCCKLSSSHTTLRKAILFHSHFRIKMETGQNVRPLVSAREEQQHYVSTLQTHTSSSLSHSLKEFKRVNNSQDFLTGLCNFKFFSHNRYFIMSLFSYHS